MVALHGDGIVHCQIQFCSFHQFVALCFFIHFNLSQTSTDISEACSGMGNKPFRKNCHLGGKKYAIFHGEKDVCSDQRMGW